PHQIRQLLNELHPTTDSPPKAHSIKAALNEAEEAVAQVKDGGESVELSPQSAYIRRLQHLIAERNALLSQSTGKDPNRRVRIFR
ncbi:MAG: single-stranded DNA-binding protein, partial [Dehalococcoidales bacterium]|nr:single-stranded DNA-binding protein [Dehalococcoidales bacterium]